MQELEEEFEDKILFGFLEGIWYLDIIYQVREFIGYQVAQAKRNCQIQIRDTGLQWQEVECRNTLLDPN